MAGWPWIFLRAGDFAEFTMPGHDQPAVWKSWGLRGGGLPYVESLRLAPVSPPRYGGFADDGLPTLKPAEQGRSET